LDTLGFKQIQLKQPKLHWFTTILKDVRKRIEISRFIKRSKDKIYKNYLFPLKFTGVKTSIKSLIIKAITFCFDSESGLRFVRKNINFFETKTSYFSDCKSLLEIEQPDLVYCTSQRTALAIAPLLAAKQLEIPTICFVFSWDNLPKATLDVTSQYFHVWSQHMKQELLHYYPFVKDSQVKVTGTPQFEPHYSDQNVVSKADFYNKYQLDSNKTYLCFSGDDVTTSPKDQLYLKDVAKAIRELNYNGHQLGLIFRRCPVDFSNRYDSVISEYKDVIIPIEPIWKKKGGKWDTILPMPEDLKLLTNLANHTAAVINLGSSMVFDFVIHKKPCFYMNYNYLNASNFLEFGVYVYNYVHFRSKPNDNVVTWLNHPDEISKNILSTLSNNSSIVESANHWYTKINMHPPELASARILESIDNIITKAN